MRSSQSNSRNAPNAKNASRSARIGCICAPVKRAARHSVATARQTGMQANTRTPADIRSSRLHNRGSAGCIVIRMMRSRSIKLWRFVHRSRWLKRFHKCCSHRFAAGRIRPMCGSARLAVAWRRRGGRSAAALLFYTGKTAHRRSRGAGRAVAIEATQSKLRIQNAACPSVFAYECCSTNCRIRGADIAPA